MLIVAVAWLFVLWPSALWAAIDQCKPVAPNFPRPVEPRYKAHYAQLTIWHEWERNPTFNSQQRFHDLMKKNKPNLISLWEEESKNTGGKLK
jgi:hypothetical protein